MSYTSEDLIRHGEAISRLLNDTSVQQVFTDLDDHYYSKWKAATTPDERELLWAKVSALGDLRQVLQGTVDSGLQELERLARLEREAHQI